NIFSGCSADFDGDGWTDFVATGSNPSDYIKIFRNRTFDNPEPNWADPTQIRTPKFDETFYQVEAAQSKYDAALFACGDLNKDGKADFVYMRCTTGSSCTPARYDIFFGDGTGKNFTKKPMTTKPANLGLVAWTSNALDIYDYNGDGYPDIVWGQVLANGNGRVVVYLSNGASPYPSFDTAVVLLDNVTGFGARGTSTVSVGDFNKDGIKDLIIGSPSSKELRMYPGLLGGGLGTYQSLNIAAWGGGATANLVGDFTQSGNVDVMVGTDGLNGYPGGKAYFYPGNGTTTPFSAGIRQSITTTATDLDLGWTMDYDHDPDHTLDFVIADGNNSGKYYLFANRTQTTYVNCGTTTSDVVDIGSLAGSNMTITSVKISPVPI